MMNDKTYTPLHVHTSKGSLLDSTNTPKSLVERAKKIGLKALAITDHGYCSNHVDFYKECKANGIKPILGMEGYIADDMTILDREQGFYHIILLAKNNKGYKNLLKISSLGHTKGFYYKPRVDLKTIRELNLGEGIVATSACFTKGNKVLTSKGYKNIEDIQMGDKVMNVRGDWERVDYPTTRAYKGDGFTITNTGDDRDITCTADHKFWVADNNNRKPRWETAQQIFESNTKRYMLYPIKVDYNASKRIIKREEWHDSAITTDPRLLKYKLPDTIELTPELMRLFGMFIGDGSISVTPKTKKICWTLSERDYPQFEPIIKAVESQLEIKFSVLTRSEHCRVDVSTASLDFINFVYYLFGNCVANTKHVPKRLRHISFELDCELLFGYFMTDGYSRIEVKDGYRYGENVFSSVSEQLIDDVQKIFATMGMRCRRSAKLPFTDRWGVHHQKSYRLTINGIHLASLSKNQFYSHEYVVSAFVSQIRNLSDRVVSYDGQRYLKIYIKNIEPIHLDTKVYCLHNQSHSFIVNNSIVHNCMAGHIPQMLLQDKPMGSVLGKIQEYKDTFEDFYLELQPTNTPDNEQTRIQQYVNHQIYCLAQHTKTKMVATSDCHFTNKEDFDLHNVFIQISQDRDNEVYENCWLKSYDEMLHGNYFGEYKSMSQEEKRHIEAILSVTNDIANDCTVELEMGNSYIPSAELPKRKKKEQYFLQLIVDGCKKRGFDKFDKDKKELYWNRIKSEYEVLEAKGFIDYFLLEYNIIHTARKNGIIISPTARGSGAGSLICYVLELTHVDPIKYHLLFERFLTIEKKGLPD